MIMYISSIGIVRPESLGTVPILNLDIIVVTTPQNAQAPSPSLSVPLHPLRPQLMPLYIDLLLQDPASGFRIQLEDRLST